METPLRSWFLLLGLAFLLGTLSSCKKDKKEPELVPEVTTGADLPPPTPEPVVQPEPVAPFQAPCELQTVYFEFDSSLLDAAAKASIEEAVNCYRDRDEVVSIRLTGACDPRGTEEYNIALGERRAARVRSYMVSLGLQGSEISVRSVGEEFATGTDETSWAMDRKVSADAE